MKFKNIIRNLLLTTMGIFVSMQLLQAQTTDIVLIEVLGQPLFGQTSIITTDAGNDISGTITESQSNTSLKITSDIKGNFNYQVWVKAINIPQGVTIEVIRTTAGNKPGAGGGDGQLSGGDEEYLAINDVPKMFFTGKGERENIMIRFQLRNISVVQPLENLGYHIIFEVMRLP